MLKETSAFSREQLFFALELNNEIFFLCRNLETTYGDAVRKTVETSIKERASTVAKLPEVAGLTITSQLVSRLVNI